MNSKVSHTVQTLRLKRHVASIRVHLECAEGTNERYQATAGTRPHTETIMQAVKALTDVDSFRRQETIQKICNHDDSCYHDVHEWIRATNLHDGVRGIVQGKTYGIG
jgi:hypothetical protein